MPTIELQDSRRLTGPNLYADVAGAVIDGRLEGVDPDVFLGAWHRRIADALEAVGWATASTGSRSWQGGVSVFHSAPIDVLYAATEVNEWAWAAAAADVGAGASPEPLANAAARLMDVIDAQRKPRLLALADAARERGLTFLSDDEHVSIGSGSGSRSWPANLLPTPGEVPWEALHDVPRVLVTGTNGKTTTVRMLAEIASAAGRTVGFTCTDGIYVDGSVVDAGDWSGPGGARALLRDTRVGLAVLETARGGMLRRGLAVERAEGALVTNVAADHLGEFGVTTVEGVAEAKLLLARSVRHGAPLLVNADDSVLAPAARALKRGITWITVDGIVFARDRLGPDEIAWAFEDGWLTRVSADEVTPVIRVSEVPAALGGAAVYNVFNALAAAALATALDLGDEAIRAGLAAFALTPEKSPGRTNVFDVAGVTILVDYVHNPHGFAAIGQLTAALESERVGMMIGHGGDRDDDAIRDLARAAWALGPARVAVKELVGYLRGREPGEVPELIRDELERLGASSDVVSVHPNEVSAAHALLAWSRPGDLLLFSSQADRQGVLQLVGRLSDAGWEPGRPVPEVG